MDALMIDPGLLGLKLLWVICQQESSEVARDDDGDARI
jgi:hypothetical protein